MSNRQQSAQHPEHRSVWHDARQLARSILSAATRTWILPRRLPKSLGSAPILVSPGASLSFLRPGLSSDLFSFAKEFVIPGSTVWDVGANVGLFTIAAAQRAGRSGLVIAIEADIWLAALLRRSASLQSPASAPIQVLSAAAFDRSSIAAFHLAKNARAMNHLSAVAGSSQTGGITETAHVLTIPLDWLMEHASLPNVLKIDVEGAEAAVLRGAQHLLATAQPIVLCEVDEINADEVTAILQAHGYHLFDYDAPRLPGGNRRPVPRATYNTLAVPAESQ